jgi:hypothetical protein
MIKKKIYLQILSMLKAEWNELLLHMPTVFEVVVATEKWLVHFWQDWCKQEVQHYSQEIHTAYSFMLFGIRNNCLDNWVNELTY